jgi:hypothetical protein
MCWVYDLCSHANASPESGAVPWPRELTLRRAYGSLRSKCLLSRCIQTVYTCHLSQFAQPYVLRHGTPLFIKTSLTQERARSAGRDAGPSRLIAHARKRRRRDQGWCGIMHPLHHSAAMWDIVHGEDSLCIAYRSGCDIPASSS